MTVLCWGVYGLLLHTGQLSINPGGDATMNRYKAFLFVGIAYFLVAVLAPLALLMMKGAAFSGYTSKGMWWSLIAGIAGAIGAFGVLLAFGAKGSPTVVMSIIFAGAPIVNAVVAIILHPPAGGFGTIKWQFYVGIVLAAAGGAMATYFKPPPPSPAKPAVTQASAAPSAPKANN
ncbi:MAG: hypothetical protein K0Q55_148 [Verrucomicrobia bacterium]|nr:hypothetical protein [Verrucomicrobiota bacterium]